MLPPVHLVTKTMENLLTFIAGPDHRLTRDHQEAWGAGGEWSAGREPILTRLVVYCHFVSCIDQ